MCIPNYFIINLQLISSKAKAAIDQKLAASDEGSILSCQIRNGFGDFLWSSRFLKWRFTLHKVCHTII